MQNVCVVFFTTLSHTYLGGPSLLTSKEALKKNCLVGSGAHFQANMKVFLPLWWDLAMRRLPTVW